MPLASAPKRLVSAAGLLLSIAAALLSVPQDAACAQPRVIVIEGDYLGQGGLPNQSKSGECSAKVVRLLKLGRVPYVTTQDSLVEREGLPGGVVAILPYNRAMTQAEAQRVAAFMDGRGKLVVFFTGHEVLLQRLGVRRVRLVETSGADPLALIKVIASIPGAPAVVRWKPEHVVEVEVMAGAGPIAVWRKRSGSQTELPAVLMNDCGAYFASEPLGMEEHSGAALLRAVIGRLAPQMWPAMLPTSPAQIGPLGRFASLAQLQAYVEREVRTEESLDEALQLANTAATLLAQAAEALRSEDMDGALSLQAEARGVAERAFWASYPPRTGELRGVWMCNYASPSWREAAKSLADANFNAIFPYMMSGGVAFYRSKVLPLHPQVKEHGDYLAEAVAAAKAVGLPLHARMLNLTTLFASETTRQSLRKSGRLMTTDQGKPSDWLCPSHPANRQMEVAAALEMAGYGVAGIQFDYLRYPWKDACFCGRCRQEFEKDFGVRVKSWPADVVTGPFRQRYGDWRREQITSLVADISHAVRRRYPDVYISAAVFLNWESHRESFGQDWVAWVDRGLVDFICPMDYTADMERFEHYVSRQEKWIGGKLPWAAGLGAYADSCEYGGPEMAVEQIRIARQHGARGFVLFNYNEDLVRDYLPHLKQGITRTPTVFDCPVGPGN